METRPPYPGMGYPGPPYPGVPWGGPDTPFWDPPGTPLGGCQKSALLGPKWPVWGVPPYSHSLKVVKKWGFRPGRGVPAKPTFGPFWTPLGGVPLGPQKYPIRDPLGPPYPSGTPLGPPWSQTPLLGYPPLPQK